ncbi:hypothetical protein LTR37_000457 [Vermiconidia calcicola]|uniref:Uncharacterized protein n=1 Tax=Vermiconidia calcicola TaxID=1690605 RepID=A0ACC3NZG9_9PEZI|nr:hypothetical protein LTR37_000457 [Vermiconidia calcicola]
MEREQYLAGRRQLRPRPQATSNTISRHPRRQLLKTHRRNPDIAAIEQANDVTSRFLQLPSEIRNIVYELVFGGITVHIESANGNGWCLAGTKLVRSVCRAPRSASRTTVTPRGHIDYDAIETYDSLHYQCLQLTRVHTANGWNVVTSGSQCLKDASFGSMLSLLSVCRQIHREAAVLPYEHAAFTFRQSTNVGLFASKLAPAQRIAVRNLSVCSTDSERYDFLPSTRIRDGMRAMKCVRNIEVFFELDEWPSEQFEDSGLSDFEVQDMVFAPLPPFSSTELHAARVTVYPSQILLGWVKLGMFVGGLSVDEIKAWGMRMEQKLLQRNPEEDQSKENKDDGGFLTRDVKRQKLS